MESRTRIATVANSIRQVSAFIRDHLDEQDMLQSNEYTRLSLMVGWRCQIWWIWAILLTSAVPCGRPAGV